MAWLREMLSDGRTRSLSTMRALNLMSGITLCICTLVLTVMVFWRVEVVPALVTFGASLSAISGLGYAAQKWSATKQNEGKQ